MSRRCEIYEGCRGSGAQNDLTDDGSGRQVYCDCPAGKELRAMDVEDDALRAETASRQPAPDAWIGPGARVVVRNNPQGWTVVEPPGGAAPGITWLERVDLDGYRQPWQVPTADVSIPPTTDQTLLMMRAAFRRMLTALPSDEAEAMRAAIEFRRMASREHVRLGFRAAPPRGRLRTPAARRWVAQADIEAVLSHLASGRGNEDVVRAVSMVAGSESVPALERITADRPMPVAGWACWALAEVGGPEAAAALARRAAAAPHEAALQEPSLARVALHAMQRLASDWSGKEAPVASPSSWAIQAAMDGGFSGGWLETPVSVLVDLTRSLPGSPLRLVARSVLDSVLANAERDLLGPDEPEEG